MPAGGGETQGSVAVALGKVRNRGKWRERYLGRSIKKSMMNSNIEKKQIDLIKESLCVFRTCDRCIDLQKKGQLTFVMIEDFVDDRGKSCLYRLKQMCHELFRNTHEATYKEKFYDITVGYIFHEAMKLREYVYQLEYYRPEYDVLVGSGELTPGERKVVHEFGIMINKAEKRLTEGLNEIRTLVKELAFHVRELVKLYRDNYLLPRFLLENEKSFVAAFGKKGYQDMVTDLYEKGRTTLVFQAALSYLKSEYYQTARALFQKAVRLDKDNQPAKFFYLYTSAYNCYFKNKFSMAQMFAEEALALSADGLRGLDVKYSQQLEILIPELCREMGKVRTRKEEMDRAYL
jgi:hypothetical protein